MAELHVADCWNLHRQHGRERQPPEVSQGNAELGVMDLAMGMVAVGMYSAVGFKGKVVRWAAVGGTRLWSSPDGRAQTKLPIIGLHA